MSNKKNALFDKRTCPNCKTKFVVLGCETRTYILPLFCPWCDKKVGPKPARAKVGVEL